MPTDGGDTPTDPFADVRRALASRLSHAAAARAGLSPAAEQWREPLHAGFPFIKRELPRNNPAWAPDIADRHEVASATRNIGIKAIRRDLMPAMRRRAY